MSSADYLKELMNDELQTRGMGQTREMGKAYLATHAKLGGSFHLLVGRIRRAYMGPFKLELPPLRPHYLDVGEILGQLETREKQVAYIPEYDLEKVDRETTYHQLYQIFENWGNIIVPLTPSSWHRLPNFRPLITQEQREEFKREQRGKEYEHSAINLLASVFTWLTGIVDLPGIEDFYRDMIYRGFPIFVEDYRYSWNPKDPDRVGTLEDDLKGAKRFILGSCDGLEVLDLGVWSDEMWLAVANDPNRHFPLFHTPHPLGWTLKPQSLTNAYDSQAKVFLKLSNTLSILSSSQPQMVLTSVFPLIQSETGERRPVDLCDWFNWAHTNVSIPRSLWKEVKDEEWAKEAQEKFVQLMRLDGIIVPLEVHTNWSVVLALKP